jgi:hypothetical protein
MAIDSASLVTLVKELGIGTVLGTIIGWSLNQWSQTITLRRDRRKALGRTLSDLLEIRHLVLAVPNAIKAFSAVVAIPPEAELFMKTFFSGWLIPAGDSLAKRYDESVTVMAETNPVLSFRLRSKHLVFPWLDQLRRLTLQHGDKDAAAIMAELETSITKEYRSVLEELIEDIAAQYGRRALAEVKKLLTRPEMALPAGIEEKLKEALLKPQKSQQGQQPPASTASASP